MESVQTINDSSNMPSQLDTQQQPKRTLSTMSQQEIRQMAEEFVLQYYTVNCLRPDYLHCFYTEDSCLIRGQRQAVYGQSGIHQLYMDMKDELKDSNAAVFSLDALLTFKKKAVLVQVTGEIAKKNSGNLNSVPSVRRFMQSFILMESEPCNYYVLNDIFQYQDECFKTVNTASTVAAEMNNTAVVPPAATSLDTSTANLMSTLTVNDIKQQHDEESAVLVEDGGDSTWLDQPTEVQQQNIAPVSVDDQQQHQTLGDSVENEVDVQQHQLCNAIVDSPVIQQQVLENDLESKPVSSPSITTTGTDLQQEPMSWSKVLTMKGKPMAPVAPRQQQQIQPQSSQAVSLGVGAQSSVVNLKNNVDESSSVMMNTNPSAMHSTAQIPNDDSNIGFGSNDQQQQTNTVTAPAAASVPDRYQLFVGNLPHSINKEELLDLFSQYGRVVDVRIQKSRQYTKTGSMLPNFGFVSFDSEAPVKEILKQKPLYYKNQRFNVEEKKTSTVQMGGNMSHSVQAGGMNNNFVGGGGVGVVNQAPRNNTGRSGAPRQSAVGTSNNPNRR